MSQEIEVRYQASQSRISTLQTVLTFGINMPAGTSAIPEAIRSAVVTAAAKLPEVARAKNVGEGFSEKMDMHRLLLADLSEAKTELESDDGRKSAELSDRIVDLEKAVAESQSRLYTHRAKAQEAWNAARNAVAQLEEAERLRYVTKAKAEQQQEMDALLAEVKPLVAKLVAASRKTQIAIGHEVFGAIAATIGKEAPQLDADLLPAYTAPQPGDGRPYITKLSPV